MERIKIYKHNFVNDLDTIDRLDTIAFYLIGVYTSKILLSIFLREYLIVSFNT